MSDITIRPIRSSDAGEVLTVQRAAFVTEALIYGDPDMAPLTQTLEEVEFELRENLGCVALSGSRLVGVVRAVADRDILLVGRIAIAPDQQGEGIGSRLLEAVEHRGIERGCHRAELFTGSLSTQNIALYERLGYRESERIDQGDGTAQVFLQKVFAEQT
ncbi:GNAT family N-acetyltransferase [uncultured Microbacterium sp.]|uniref:GNAT family N-acetyltransferase n=1 Tax=uncultured Microbacterium sp. TaxID=191216 RepID=UPI0025D46412|nr:GNAT family N-acetyltransferase [uncultured Microbacterium sp.]